MEFIPLEEIAQKEIPLVENEVNKMIEYEHLSYLVEQILDNFNNARIKSRIKKVTMAFYGIGCDEKTLKEMSEDYQQYRARFHQIYDAKIKGDRVLKTHSKELFRV